MAFVPRYIPVAKGEKPPEFPPIVGTGFIVDDGLVITNHHVVRALARLPRGPDAPADEWPFSVLLLHEIPSEGIAQVHLHVLGVGALGEIKVEGHYYGPRRLDLAAVHIKAKGLPKVAVDSTAVPLEEGQLVATAGFPMGTDALVAPGYLHQMTPTLQQGIISAVLPFATAKPHALMINVMTQGGASGSPVFAPDRAAVVGVLYAGLNDVATSPGLPAPYRVPTNQSYVVPAHYLEYVLEKVKGEKGFALPPDTLSLDEMIATYQLETMKPRGEFGLVKDPTGQGVVRSLRPLEIDFQDEAEPGS